MPKPHCSEIAVIIFAGSVVLRTWMTNKVKNGVRRIIKLWNENWAGEISKWQSLNVASSSDTEQYNPCTWHLILTSLAPSIARNTIVTLTGASHCHIVWNSNNSVITTPLPLLSTYFNQFNLKTTLEPLLTFLKSIFVSVGSLLTLHYCFVSATGTGDYKVVYFPGSDDVLLVIMNPSSSNAESCDTAQHSQYNWTQRCCIYLNECKIILNILCRLVSSNVALLTPVLSLQDPCCQIVFLIALNKIYWTMHCHNDWLFQGWYYEP